jgi:Fe-S-cluster-containing dehydrogenase component
MASCVLENGWTVGPRYVYTYNSEVITSLPLINLSLACNHCEEPVCLKGCPSGSFFRESLTGAIIIDDRKCIGCRYCQWNCPYDAPKFDDKKKIIGKCNLCYSELTEGRSPACANSCPTGALNYGELSETTGENIPLWFPEKNLNPAIVFTGKADISPLRIIPEKAIETERLMSHENRNPLTGVWSLIGFSFLTALSVSELITSFINGDFPDPILFISTIFAAGIISLFHTGKLFRAWRSLSNLRTSPLSREIAIFLIYSMISVPAVFFELPALLIASSAVGLILLIAIDSVYIYADRSKSVIIHSGQTFMSSLLIISFFTGSSIPFIFVALIKIVFSVYNLSAGRRNGAGFLIKFSRLALLVVAGISLITGISYPGTAIALLFLTGEFLDRINYYIDFKPINIRTSIYDHLIIEEDATKRG